MIDLAQPRIPLTLLTGFLGAGKTTLLNRLLRDPALSGAAVVINEFGAVGIDHLLVERVDDGIVLLAAGCLCCTIRGDLIDTLRDLLARRSAGQVPPFDRVVIETTGLADPAPILQTLTAHPDMAAAFVLDGVVTVVDAVNAMATFDAHPESVKQAAVADRIVLSKLDLAGDTAALRARLLAINPAAMVLPATAASAAGLIGVGPWLADGRAGDVRAWLAAEAVPDASGADHHHHHHGPGGHGGHDHHDRNRHDDHIRAFSLVEDRAIPAGTFEMFLDLVRAEHGPKLLRYKGLVKLADDPSRPVLLHGVQHVLHEPVRLPAWPDADRRTRLVFIVRDIEPAVIDRLFAAFTGQLRIDQPDAAALTDNPLSLR